MSDLVKPPDDGNQAHQAESPMSRENTTHLTHQSSECSHGKNTPDRQKHVPACLPTGQLQDVRNAEVPQRQKFPQSAGMTTNRQNLIHDPHLCLAPNVVNQPRDQFSFAASHHSFSHNLEAPRHQTKNSPNQEEDSCPSGVLKGKLLNLSNTQGQQMQQLQSNPSIPAFHSYPKHFTILQQEQPQSLSNFICLERVQQQDSSNMSQLQVHQQLEDGKSLNQAFSNISLQEKHQQILMDSPTLEREQREDPSNYLVLERRQGQEVTNQWQETIYSHRRHLHQTQNSPNKPSFVSDQMHNLSYSPKIMQPENLMDFPDLERDHHHQKHHHLSDTQDMKIHQSLCNLNNPVLYSPQVHSVSTSPAQQREYQTNLLDSPCVERDQQPRLSKDRELLDLSNIQGLEMHQPQSNLNTPALHSYQMYSASPSPTQQREQQMNLMDSPCLERDQQQDLSNPQGVQMHHVYQNQEGTNNPGIYLNKEPHNFPNVPNIQRPPYPDYSYQQKGYQPSVHGTQQQGLSNSPVQQSLEVIERDQQPNLSKDPLLQRSQVHSLSNTAIQIHQPLNNTNNSDVHSYQLHYVPHPLFHQEHPINPDSPCLEEDQQLDLSNPQDPQIHQLKNNVNNSAFNSFLRQNVSHPHTPQDHSNASCQDKHQQQGSHYLQGLEGAQWQGPSNNEGLEMHQPQSHLNTPDLHSYQMHSVSLSPTQQHQQQMNRMDSPCLERDQQQDLSNPQGLQMHHVHQNQEGTNNPGIYLNKEPHNFPNVPNIQRPPYPDSSNQQKGYQLSVHGIQQQGLSNFPVQQSLEVIERDHQPNLSKDPLLQRSQVHSHSQYPDASNQPSVHGTQQQGLLYPPVHQRVQAQIQSLCPKHHKEAEFYCITDQTRICSSCFLHGHNGHEVVELPYQEAEQSPARMQNAFPPKEVPPPGLLQFSSVRADSVTLNWSPPHGAPGHYKYRVSWSGGEEHHSTVVRGLSLQLNKLQPGEVYHFTIATVSEDGRASQCVGETLQTDIPAPDYLTLDVQPSSATVKWNKPAQLTQAFFQLELFAASHCLGTILIDQLEYTFNNLQHGAGYTICVSTLLRNKQKSKPISKTFTAGYRLQETSTMTSVSAASPGSSRGLPQPGYSDFQSQQRGPQSHSTQPRGLIQNPEFQHGGGTPSSMTGVQGCQEPGEPILSDSSVTNDPAKDLTQPVLSGSPSEKTGPQSQSPEPKLAPEFQHGSGNSPSSSKELHSEKVGEQPEGGDLGSPTNNITDLFSRLCLDLRKIITTSDVLTIASHSVHSHETCTEKEVGKVFLQRILTGNYSARDISVQVATVASNTKDLPQKSQGKSGLSALLRKTNQHKLRKPAQIHPMDVQMAVFHCADHFLKQLIVTKLSQCQYALPLLVPKPLKPQEIEFPLWTFQQIKKSWKTTDSTGQVVSKSQSVCRADTPMVAFFRLGSVSSSKSQLMNSLINEKHNTFFHRNCPGSSRTRLLMEGVVEIAWYCPSGKPTDKFTECVAFCNLHGDAGASPVQRMILTEMATTIVFLLPALDENDNSVATIVDQLLQIATPVICIFTEDEDPISEVGEGKYKLGLKGRNQAEVSAELRQVIQQNLSGESISFKVENVSSYSEIKVDMKTAECRRGRDAAESIMQLLKQELPSKVKEIFLPCQGKLWHDWSQKNKELHRLRGDIEKEKDSKHNEMKQIRKNQNDKGMSKIIKLLTEHLRSLPKIEKKYFLKWVASLLDDFTSSTNSEVFQEYYIKWKQVSDLKKKPDKPVILKTAEKELEDILDKLNATTYGLEHFLREMGQVYEAWESTGKNLSENDKTIPSLPRMAAELMISGHPVELMDGDAAHVPLLWITAVVDELIKILGDQRVFVLSVLGLQSSGKSTMLNAMFGLQFAVSAGRCTRGAFMQLVTVSEEMKAELKVDCILVVDTEGLRALELMGKVTAHHDNELATFVVGLGNMTLINIFGENPSEMQDILQIVIQAFLRMKKVRLNPRCIFVHQNVTDVTAGEKNMEGRKRLQEKLDEMTKLAAKEEVDGAESFSDVIAFDIDKDVKYFAQLWEGSPPMAPPNPSYSENIQDLKETILSYVSRAKSLTLSAFKERITSLWDALLSEEFVFSFKNTLEISVYRKLEEEYCKWTWTLRSEMLKIEDQLHVKIMNKVLEEVNINLTEIAEMRKTLEKVQNEMQQCFGSDKDKDTKIQWKKKFELRIVELHDELVERTMKKMNNVTSQRNARKKLDEMKEHHEKKLLEKSKELAMKLKDKGNTETELKKEFDSMWGGWVSDLTRDIPPIKDINIRQDMIDVLTENSEYGIVRNCNCAGKYHLISNVGDYSDYVIIKSGLKENITFWKSKGLTHDDQVSIRELINNVSSKSDLLVNSKPVSEKGYSSTYMQEIAQLVKDCVIEYKPQKVIFEFKKEFTVDLSLYVCHRAAEKFLRFHKIFTEENNLHNHLAKKKPGYYDAFKKYCEGATSTAVLGGLISSELKEAILKRAYNKTANDLADQIRRSVDAFSGNRFSLEKHILVSLAEKENFYDFMAYINNPKEYFKTFIKDEVKKYMSGNDKGKSLSIIKGHIEGLNNTVLSAAQVATETAKNRGVSTWLSQFAKGLEKELEYSTNHLSAESYKDVSDFGLLLDFLRGGLTTVTEELKGSFRSVSDLRMEMCRQTPEDILIEQLCQGCWETCPFCRALCTGSMENHIRSDKDKGHSALVHRSRSVIGGYYRNTDNFSLGFCSTLVRSDISFYNDKDEKIPYRDHKSGGGRFATWEIDYDPSELGYWKWFVCRFKTDLENKYNNKFKGEGQIPSGWEWWKDRKREAIESLKAYR